MFEVFLYRIVLLMKKLIIWKAFQNVVKKTVSIYIYLIVTILHLVTQHLLDLF